MLTGDLVRVRFSKEMVIPLYLNRNSPQWLEAAESLLAIFREGVGMTRGEIEEEIDDLFGERREGDPDPSRARQGAGRSGRVRGGRRRPSRAASARRSSLPPRNHAGGNGHSVPPRPHCPAFRLVPPFAAMRCSPQWARS